MENSDSGGGGDTVPLLDDIAAAFTTALARILRTTDDLVATDVTELSTPGATDIALEEEAAAAASGNNNIPVTIASRIDVQITYPEDTVPSDFRRKRQLLRRFGWALARDFPAVTGVAYRFPDEEQIYYFFPPITADNRPRLRRPHRRHSRRVLDHWTPLRLANATPRDYYIDGDGDRNRQLRSSSSTRSLQAAIQDDPWLTGGMVQTAVGRVYFQMKDAGGTKYVNYLCSGTVVTEAVTGRSIVLTAAHCTFDQVHGEFAKNVLFIPNQDGTTGNRSNRNCDDDPLGCWVPEFGVVDQNWAGLSWPQNVQWDYGYFVVPDTDAHQGPLQVSDALDEVVDTLPIDFTSYPLNQYGQALGYPGNRDPVSSVCCCVCMCM